jgi:cytochrome c-type biogenesis protein CcmE
MGDQAQVKRVRVDGFVQAGSIVRNGSEVSFVIHQDPNKRQLDNMTLKIVYRGIDPLPDTFKDDAQALADGKLGADGVFQASKIQAKCASKYEAKPQLKKDASQAGI